MKYYIAVWKKYADFRGRSRRMEYWMFALIHILAFFVALGLDYSFGNLNFAPAYDSGMKIPYFYLLLALASFIPALAVTVRRLHDAGKSGWYYFVSLIPLIGTIWLLILLFTDSEPGTNKWGPNPKAVEAEPLITY